MSWNRIVRTGAYREIQEEGARLRRGPIIDKNEPKVGKEGR